MPHNSGMDAFRIVVVAMGLVGCANTLAVPTEAEKRHIDGVAEVEPEVEPAVMVANPDELKSDVAVDVAVPEWVEPEWCFHITDELLELFPHAEDTLQQAGLQWDIDVVADDRCARQLTLAVIPQPDHGFHPGAYDGKHILVSQRWSENEVILDLTKTECDVEYGGARYLLRDILIHELGHALGVAHNENSLMKYPTGYCEWLELAR